MRGFLGDQRPYCQRPQRNGWEKNPVVLSDRTGEQNLAGPDRQGTSGKDTYPQRENAPPNDERQDPQKPGRKGRRQAGNHLWRRGWGKPEQAAENQRKSGVKILPKPAMVSQPMVAKVQAERYQAAEVGNRDGREPGDDDQPRGQ